MLLLIATSTMAQKSSTFLGTVKMKMTIEGNMSEAEKAQSEGDVTFTYGDGMKKEKMERMMGSVTEINFIDSFLIMQERMGQQMAFRMTKTEKEEIEASVKQADTVKADINVVLYDETKTVAGLKCKKAEIEEGENIIEVYYYPGYKLAENLREDGMEKIEGLPLEFIIPIDEENSVKFVATEVKKKKKMKAKDFQLPVGVKIMSFEEVRAMMGQ